MQWETRPHLATANQNVSNAGGERTRIFILDTRNSSLSDIKYTATHYHVHAIGSLWLMDRAEPSAPLDGYSMDEREPSWWQWLWLGPVEPVRRIRWSPWVTWEWRTLLGQPTAPPPQTDPPTLDELRIAHNAALERNDAKAAAALRARIQSALDLRRGATFDGDTTLLGGVHHRGARRGLTLYFVAGKFDVDGHFKVHAKVLRPPRLSTLPARSRRPRAGVGANLADDPLAQGPHLSLRHHLPEAPRHRGVDRRVEPRAPPYRQRPRAPRADSPVM